MSPVSRSTSSVSESTAARPWSSTSAIRSLSAAATGRSGVTCPGSFRGFGRPCSLGRHCCPRASSRGVHCSFRVLTRVVSAVFGSPIPPRRRPLAAALRSSDTDYAGQPFNRPAAPLVEFRAPAEFCPTSPSRTLHQHVSRPKPSRRRQIRSAPLLDFPALQHFEETEVHLRTDSNPRCVPPAGFGYPLDGFLPPNPCRLCFTPTALVGLSPAEFSPFRR